MFTRKRRILLVIGICACCVVIALAIVVGFIVSNEMLLGKTVYVTEDVANYGVIIGNYNNEHPSKFIKSFFPERIEEMFSDVKYYYKAKKFDTYAYEMCLEVTVADAEQYHVLVETTIGDKVCAPFSYDSSYQECIISNYFSLTNTNTDEAPHYIEDAEVGRVLFSDSKQKIIFVAFGVYDGGGTNTDELGYFFDKFNIDPVDFEKQAWSGIH